MGFTHDALSLFKASFDERGSLETFGWKRLAWFLCYAYNERRLIIQRTLKHVKTLICRLI